jgi:hypothetical protein
MAAARASTVRRSEGSRARVRHAGSGERATWGESPPRPAVLAAGRPCSGPGGSKHRGVPGALHSKAPPRGPPPPPSPCRGGQAVRPPHGGGPLLLVLQARHHRPRPPPPHPTPPPPSAAPFSLLPACASLFLPSWPCRLVSWLPARARLFCRAAPLHPTQRRPIRIPTPRPPLSCAPRPTGSPRTPSAWG